MSSTAGTIRLNGYRRDDRGTWRYETTGQPVPGARDITLADYWNLRPEPTGEVLIPMLCVELSETLTWARHAPLAARPTTWRGMKLPALRVEAEEWNERRSEVVSMTAPELAPHLLLDVAAIAAVLGIAASTVRTYVARGYLPPPTIEGLSFPVWSVPQIVATLSARRGQGRPRATPVRPHSAPRPRRGTEPMSLDDIDAALARLGLDDTDLDLDDDTNDTDVVDDSWNNTSDRYRLD